MSPDDGFGLSPEPLEKVRAWFEEAEAEGLFEPDAMALATASPDGMPSVRIVLLKGIDSRGLRFFTNYGSRKGRELDANPRAAVTIHWATMHRAVRAEIAVHEPDVATYAKRRVEVRDGRILQDEPVKDRHRASDDLRNIPDPDAAT